MEIAIHGNSSSWLSILQSDARNVDPFTLCPTIIIRHGQEISNLHRRRRKFLDITTVWQKAVVLGKERRRRFVEMANKIQKLNTI